MEESYVSSSVQLKGKNTLILIVTRGSSVEHRRKVMNNWYRLELKKLIPSIIQKWEKKIGVQIEGWGIRQMKTKWGTCNIKAKRIWLNLELAKKPINCIEYIVVHELVHLLERNHNELFLKNMDKYMPLLRKNRDELNQLPVSHLDWEY